mmetsp:Transcript_31468/g.46699  ORF Transcript_31468/g.46699 Transcript_31468/m.46699 type:complete len:291 (-) Transcript_31468:97-969(-)|eukprot:CAMPEP_0194041482 /NCGR_PEP_ID=MMETSP0009_2-20130614/13387_1 /TAXON_ID=210454 /ORGANISM="Grammatophora oceanica, Strain CCMP 410" /LENGTH=290 /DNA_ID=CAMNT_0038685011 /DNA_START=67 /DNA_END=939 /DNA_ORIENTATION=+
MDETRSVSEFSSSGDCNDHALVPLTPPVPQDDVSACGKEIIEILSERDRSPVPLGPHHAGANPDQKDLRRFIWYLMDQNGKLKSELEEVRRQNLQGAALLAEIDQVMMKDIDRDSKKLYLENYHENIEMRRKDKKKSKKEKRSKKKSRNKSTESKSALDKSWQRTSVSTLVTESTSDMTHESDDLSVAGERDMPRDLYLAQGNTREESLTVEYLDSRSRHDDDGESAASLAAPTRIFHSPVERTETELSSMFETTRTASSPALDGIVCKREAFLNCVVVHGHDKSSRKLF